MKNKKIFSLAIGSLILPVVVTPIISCSETKEDYMDAYNSELGFFFNNRGVIYGYEGPNGDGTWKDQKIVTIPEYLEVTSPKTSPIYGRKYKIKEINPQGRISSSPETQLWLGTNLEEIILPDSIERIGYDTFNSSKLSKINWPKNLLSIYDRAFSNTLFSEITFPPSLESIGAGAFSDSKKLKSINFSNLKNLKSINYNAFRDCILLEGELNFSTASSLRAIYQGAFRNTKINKVILPSRTRYVQDDPDGYYDSFPKDCIIEGGVPTTYQDIKDNYWDF